MILAPNGQTFTAHRCPHIGVTGLRCTVRMSDPGDLELHLARHALTDEHCKATADQKRAMHPEPWETTAAKRKARRKPKLRGYNVERQALERQRLYVARRKARMG